MKMFELHHAKIYYIKHPFILLKHVYYNLKYAKQRVFRGWDDLELWNMYSYFLERNAEMLNVLANTSVGYPANSSEEEWENTLLKIANGFKSGIKFSDLDTVAWDEKYNLMTERDILFLSPHNIIDEEYNRIKISEIDKEINFRERHDKEMNELEKNFNEAMKLFVDNFWQLWD